MERKDLRNKIIPTVNKTRVENSEIITTDLIYLEDYNEYKEGITKYNEMYISGTDYAKMNNLLMSKLMKTNAGRHTASAWLREGYNDYQVCYVSRDFGQHVISSNYRMIGVCPSLRYNLPTDISKTSVFNFLKDILTKNQNKKLDIRKVKDKKFRTLYHTIQIGEYPKSKVNEELSGVLEALYNNGDLKKGIMATGRWFSSNGQNEPNEEYCGKHSPEFEYKGNRYVRVISQIYSTDSSDYLELLKPSVYSDGTLLGESGTVRWVKVEPISFIIKNWDEMPKGINPKGNGKATYFDLRAEEVIFSNLPFYPTELYSHSSVWKNSYIRGFLNGLDIRKINENEFDFYKADGGNFSGDNNFINEAFNLSREPIIEYAIPDSEFKICDNAFNGCVSLKKVILHPKVNHIGKKAFEGLNFKYVYRTEDGNLTFSQELPSNRNKYKNLIELRDLEKNLVGCDYSILVESKKIDEVTQLSEVLTKNKFSIPYKYASVLIKCGKAKTFYENSYFKFFKKEFPNINDELLKFPEEERLDFFKFANALGCFSKQKILDKNGVETETFMAQKACLLLARLIKTDKMKLR